MEFLKITKDNGKIIVKDQTVLLKTVKDVTQVHMELYQIQQRLAEVYDELMGRY